MKLDERYLEDLQALKDKIPDEWALCELFDGVMRSAAEAETMVAQTLHAACINLKKRGEPFSIRSDNVFTRTGAGLVNNGGAYHSLLEDGYFIEEKRGEETVIFCTRKLLDHLIDHVREEGLK